MITNCYACGETVSDLDKKCRKCGAGVTDPQILRVAGRAIQRTIRPHSVRKENRKNSK